MAVENLKSTPITNADATPVLANTAGHGAPAVVHTTNGFVAVSASASTTSTYRLVRLKSNVILKAVVFQSEAQGAGKFNLSMYYSDSTTDGTQPSLQGLIVPTTGDQFIAADIDCASAVSPTNETNQSGNYTIDKQDKQLWDALGLTSDPGGFFDIVAVVHTTAVTTGTGRIAARAEFVYG